MRTPRRLPPDLQDRAFSRSDAADQRVPLGRLRRRDLVRPFHGVHADALPATLLERCRAYAVRMRADDVFSHVTAALVHDIPLPARLEHRVAIDVAALYPAAAPSTRGVIGHRLRNRPPVVRVDGMPFCEAAETWAQLAGLLDVEELVIAADHLLGDGTGPGPCSRADLLTAVAAPGRYRTAPLRAALRLARVGSRSPQESRLRVVLVSAGLPQPELNAEVTARDGRVLGHGDLVWPHRRAVSEYEGDQHRTDQDQYAYDIRRYDAFHAAGWGLTRVTADDLRTEMRPKTVARVRDSFRT